MEASRNSFRLAQIGQWPVPVKEERVRPVEAQVSVRILHAGLCHSDLHMAEGYFDQGDGRKAKLPPMMLQDRVLGHEPMGVVEEMGPDATGVRVGDRVVVYPWIGCENCRFCLNDEEHLCIMPRNLGVQLDGAFSTHMLVPHSRYVIPIGNTDPRFACVCACSGLTAYSALRKFGKVTDDSKVLLCGAGGLGFMALNIFKHLYPTHPGPILMDVDDRRLELAVKAGLCSRTINSKTQREALVEMQAGAGFLQGIDFAADFVGAGETVGELLRAMNKGSTLVVVGLFGGNFKMVPSVLPLRQIRIQGTFVGSLTEMRELMQLASQGAVKAMPIDERPFSALPQAFEDLKQGKVVGRVVFTVGPSAGL